MKNKIKELLYSNNSGICTHAIKFLENLVLLCSEPSVVGKIEKFRPGGFEFESLPDSESYLINKPLLHKEAESTLKLLYERLEDENLPASNVTAIINALTVIVKQRTTFISHISFILIDYYTKLPDTLTKTQKKSISHALKLAMQVILKLHISGPWNGQLQQCLSGKIVKGAKRKSMDTSSIEPKRQKMTPQSQPQQQSMYSIGQSMEILSPSGIPINSLAPLNIIPESFNFIMQIPLDIVVGFVLENLNYMTIPQIPPTESPSPNLAQDPRKLQLNQTAQEIVTEHVSPTKQKPMLEQMQEKKMDVDKDVETVTKEKPKSEAPPTSLSMATGYQSISRIIKYASQKSSRSTNDSYSTYLYDVILSKLAVSIPQNDPGLNLLLEYISNSLNPQDAPSQSIYGSPSQAKNIIILWLHAEYSKSLKEEKSENPSQRYEFLLNQILLIIRTKLDPSSDLLPSIILNLPSISENVFMNIQSYCEEPENRKVGLTILRDLVLSRPFCRNRALDILLSYVLHQDELIRTEAIKLLSQKKMIQNEAVYNKIKEFALEMMNYILTSEYETFVEQSNVKPEKSEQTQESDQMQTEESESKISQPQEEESAEMDEDKLREMNSMIIEEDIKKRLLLIMALCLKKHELIHNFADIFVKTNLSQVKKVMLRVSVDLIRKIGQNSEDLLSLILDYPDGSDTFILHTLYILTEKSEPSQKLVEAVMNVYKNKKNDPRLLVPILSGLSREEIISILPAIVSLPTSDLKRAISRLLDTKRPISLKPTELLVQLHLISAEKHNLSWKKIVEATQFCFENTKVVVKQEVLASVLQQLVEITPLPFLFMRTVIQTIGKCGQMLDFVMRILTRLINKQIWKDEHQWRGFVKACAVSIPNSVEVMLQLPPEHFEKLLKDDPNLKEKIISVLQMSGKTQSVPKALQKILNV